MRLATIVSIILLLATCLCCAKNHQEEDLLPINVEPIWGVAKDTPENQSLLATFVYAIAGDPRLSPSPFGREVFIGGNIEKELLNRDPSLSKLLVPTDTTNPGHHQAPPLFFVSAEAINTLSKASAMQEVMRPFANASVRTANEEERYNYYYQFDGSWAGKDLSVADAGARVLMVVFSNGEPFFIEIYEKTP